MSLQFSNVLPAWLTVLLSAALLAALVHGTLTMLRRRVSATWVTLLTTLRLLIFGIFLLILLQPAISYTRSVSQFPELLVLVDTSESMAKPSGAQKGTRLEEVASGLQIGDWSEHLRSKYDVSWFSFDRTASRVHDNNLGTLRPTGADTCFAESILAAVNHARAQGKSPSRLLLATDGNDRSSIDPVDTARRLGLAIDVIAPSAATTTEAAAPEISEVQSSRRVLLGSETHFRVTLDGKSPAPKDRPLLLRVTEDGKKILEHPITLNAGRVQQSVVLSHRPATAGLRQFEFLLGAADDRNSSAYPLAVQVIDSKYEVLILEDRWRWEYKYLHRLFEDDPSFRFSALLARGKGAFVQQGSPDRRVNLVGFPQSKADLENFDLFVLGDVTPSQWPQGLARGLARLVADEGKSLVVIAGPQLSNLVDVPELHALLPVELTPDSGKPVDGPLDIRLRPDSASSPFFFQLQSGATEKLPAVDQIFPALRKRPGATVLLEAVKHRNSYGPSIVLAEHTVGRGRVLFLGTDTLWKWHTLASTDQGPTPYTIFWQQAFRAMTPPRSAPGNINLWLTANRSRVEVGKPVLLEAELQSTRPLPSGSLEAALTTPDQKRLPLVCVADPANPHLYRTEFICPGTGLQQISASFLSAGKVLAEANTAIQVNEPRAEKDDVGIDRNNLARIAQATGGHFIDPDRPETWPVPQGDSIAKVDRPQVIDLWNSSALLLILCVLLGADWFIRLFRGLIVG